MRRQAQSFSQKIPSLSVFFPDCSSLKIGGAASLRVYHCLQNCFPENLKTFPKFRVPKQHAQQHVFENSFDLPFFAFQVPLKWIDEAQIITATIDRKKVQVHGQLDVGCRHFRWLLRRVFRFVAKVHARCRSTYATLRRNRPSPSYTGAANRHQSNCSYRAHTEA